MSAQPTAPCHLDKAETSGDPDNWPGSPCLIEYGLCLTCGLKTTERQVADELTRRSREWGLPE